MPAMAVNNQHPRIKFRRRGVAGAMLGGVIDRAVVPAGLPLMNPEWFSSDNFLQGGREWVWN
jgi:hypothetical protein